MQAYRIRADVPFGIDYDAYLQQAHAVLQGERNYLKLSSNLGAAYYPANHIWHYILFVLVHQRTPDAIFYMRCVHNLIYQLTLYFVIKIAYLYFPDEDESAEEGVNYDKSAEAQLFAFMFLSNKIDREYQSMMYND